MKEFEKPYFVERILPRVTFTDTCWLWTGAKNGPGYGMLKWWGDSEFVHRLSYECWNGPIPEGLVINHLCEVKSCLNPDHLEAVTNAENRAYSAGTCKKGHNMDRVGRTNRGQCKVCAAEYAVEWRRRKVS